MKLLYALVKSLLRKEMNCKFKCYLRTHPDLSFACGKACINKMVSWECVESLCPSGSLCRNRRFQLHQYSEVYPVPTKDRVSNIFI